MNPFNNKWLALLVVAGVLLVVSELAGSGGILSRTAGTDVAANGEELPPGVVQVVEGDTVDGGEVPVEDQPQIFVPDSPEIDDAENDPGEEAEGAEPEDIDPDAIDDAGFEEDDTVTDE